MSCPVYDLESRKKSMTLFSEIMSEINV